ncbi:MAG: hypothetical protein J6S85_20490 [Methanobrevibacter sp.]|nr:hypothetical protein [Methanobrevibacter sp.]
MNRKIFLNKMSYIYWQKEAIYKTVDNKTWMSILKMCKRNGGKRAESKTKRSDFNDNDYLVVKKGSYDYLYTYNQIDGYRVYTTNPMDDNKNYRLKADKGKTAFNLLESKFKELNDGMTLRKAFGYSEEEIKRCIPKSFYYTNPKYLNIPLPSVSACDWCSHYPSNGCDRLPNWDLAIRRQGTVKPTKEYPFAFYIKSGHSAELNVYDTHSWLDSKFFKALFRWDEKTSDAFNDIPLEDDETILCPSAQYTLTECWKYFYSKRKEDSNAKLVMNASIGFMHLKKYRERRLGHVASVIIARANDKMLKLAEKIGFNKVCHIVIDGIIYLGEEEYGSNEKKLNNLYQEHTDVECIIRGSNAYIMKKNGKIIDLKHGAYDMDSRGKEITIENCKGFDDIFEWHRAEGIVLEEGDYYENLQEE